jgi:hypothetical protein
MRAIVRIASWGPVRFLFCFALLAPPWPAFGRAYGRAVGTLADAALGEAAAPVTLRFSAATAWQLKVHAEDPQTGRFVGTLLDLRRAGYIATAVFVALALATPLRWGNRLALLGAGVTLLQLLPLLPLLWFFSGELPVQAFRLGSLARSSIAIAYHALVAPPGMAYALPGLLWLFLRWLIAPRAQPRPRILGIASTIQP